MDNAAKYAGAAGITVRAWETAHALQFTVCDTGCGFDPGLTPRGAGLSNMHDRIAAVGGTLSRSLETFAGNTATRQRPGPLAGHNAGRRPPRRASPSGASRRPFGLVRPVFAPGK